MKSSHAVFIGLALFSSATAEPVDEEPKETPAELLAKHENGALKLADEQDELSADVQDLIDEQTDAKVIELLQAAEIIMADAVDQLEQKNTSGETLAAQTEVIEKIFEAAKQKNKKQGQGEGEGQPQQGQGQGESGMMEMLKRMMDGGQDLGEAPKPSEQKGQQPGQGGDQPGEGKGSGSASGDSGDPDNTAEGGQRRVPKNSGKAGSTLPREFQKAMDAYNRGAAQKSSQR